MRSDCGRTKILLKEKCVVEKAKNGMSEKKEKERERRRSEINFFTCRCHALRRYQISGKRLPREESSEHQSSGQGLHIKIWRYINKNNKRF